MYFPEALLNIQQFYTVLSLLNLNNNGLVFYCMLHACRNMKKWVQQGNAAEEEQLASHNPLPHGIS